MAEQKLKGSIPSGGLEGMAACDRRRGSARRALRMAQDGAAVTICGRTESKPEDAASRIEAAAAATRGRSVQLTSGDVTNEDDVQRIMKAAEPTGELDGVVANAGGGGGMGPYHVQDTDEFIRVLHLNVLGTMLCVKHSVPYMVKAGGGSFVGMSRSPAR